jgi:hypothetical protein
MAATMVDEPYVTQIQTLTAGTKQKEVQSFYRD